MEIFGISLEDPGPLRQVDLDYDQEAWPYRDLSLKTPHCPNCGTPAQLLVGERVVPTAYCPSDDCPSLTWGPHLSAVEVMWELLADDCKDQLRPPGTERPTRQPE